MNGTIDILQALFSLRPGDFKPSASIEVYSEQMGANGADLPGKAAKLGNAKAPGAALKKGQPFWADFGKNLNQQSKNLGDGVNTWWTNMSTQSKNWKAPKWEMPGEELYELSAGQENWPFFQRTDTSSFKTCRLACYFPAGPFCAYFVVKLLTSSTIQCMYMWTSWDLWCSQ